MSSSARLESPVPSISFRSGMPFSTGRMRVCHSSRVLSTHTSCRCQRLRGLALRLLLRGDSTLSRYSGPDPLLRSSFFEQRDGNCRLMAPFASKLSQTAPTWAHLVAPVAEWFAREIFNSTRIRQSHPAARLTKSNKREARGRTPFALRKPKFKSKRVCRGCGKQLEGQRTNCYECSREINRERITNAAFSGRVAAQRPGAKAKRAATVRINTQAAWDWNPSDQPAWLTKRYYSEKIQPILASKSSTAIASLLNVSFSMRVTFARVESHIRGVGLPWQNSLD